MKNSLYRKAKRIISAVITAAVIFSCATFAFAETYDTYTVKNGDTLSSIAARFGVTAEEIASANGLTAASMIAAGMTLNIPSTVEAADGDAPESYGTVSYSEMVSDMNTRVSVNFRSADIRDVLSSFAVNLGYNFIYKGSAATVTLNLTDVTIGQALDYVMKYLDLTYITDGKTIIVGPKNTLVNSFSEALQLAVFETTYLPADIIMSQISTLSIDVTTVLAGENEKRFIVQGLPADLSKVRDLISMVDIPANVSATEAAIISNYYAIETTYITANEFSRVLSSASLPAGITLALKPQTLYVYATPDQYAKILSIRKVVDTKNPEAEVIAPEQEMIKQVKLKYVTLDLIEDTMLGYSDVSVIKIATNKTTFWLNGIASEIAKAEKIIKLLDISSNAPVTPEDAAPTELRTITTKHLKAEAFNKTLSYFGLPTGYTYPDNPYVLYITATEAEFKSIDSLKTLVDTAANGEKTVAEIASTLRAVKTTYITAETLSATLSNVSLPAGFSFPDNPKTLYLFVNDEDYESVKEVLKIVDTAENATADDATIAASLVRVSLIYIDASTASAFIGSLGLDNISVITSSNAQKAIWLKGSPTSINEAMASLATLDVYGAGVTNSYTMFTLSNISASEMASKIGLLGLSGVKTFTFSQPSISRNILISYPSDMAATIAQIVASLDVQPTTYLSKQVIETYSWDCVVKDANGNIYREINPHSDTYVPVPVETLRNRIDTIAKMTGISAARFYLSENISTAENGVLYALYLANATSSEYDRVKNVLSVLGSGAKGETPEDETKNYILGMILVNTSSAITKPNYNNADINSAIEDIVDRLALEANIDASSIQVSYNSGYNPDLNYVLFYDVFFLNLTDQQKSLVYNSINSISTTTIILNNGIDGTCEIEFRKFIIQP